MTPILAALVNGGIVSAGLTAAVWLIVRLAGRRWNASTRYVVWCSTLLITAAMPICFLPTAHSRAPLREIPAPAFDESARREFSAEPPSPIALAVQAPRQPAGTRLPVFPVTIAAGSWPVRVAGAWLLVSLLMLGRLIASFLILERLKARAAPTQRWRAFPGACRRRVRIAVSSELTTPLAVGPYRPSILIPARLVEELDEAEMEQIVLHEAAHLARFDDYALAVQRLMEALLAFHPAARWIARRIELEREIACDDFVLQATSSPRPYAACLTRVAELTGGLGGALLAAPAITTRSNLERRVEMLLDENRNTGTRVLKTRLAIMACAVAAMVWIGARTPGLVAFAATPQAAPPARRPMAIPDPPMPRPAAPAPAPAVLLAQQRPQVERPPAPGPADLASPTVMVQVLVTDPKKRIVTGLEKAQFKLFADGLEQEISHFSAEYAPLSLAIVVDASGGEPQFARQVVAELLKAADPSDEFSLILADTQPGSPASLWQSGDEIRNRLASLASAGAVTFSDGGRMAFERMKTARNWRKAELFIRDRAGDPILDRDEAGRIAGTGQFQMLVTFPDPSGPSGLRFASIDSFLSAEPSARAQSIAAWMGVESRNYYLLGFPSKYPVRDGKFHQIRVELAVPRGLPPLNLEYRQGYYAPAQ